MQAGGETGCRLPCTHFDHADMQVVSHSRRDMSLNHGRWWWFADDTHSRAIQLWIWGSDDESTLETIESIGAESCIWLSQLGLQLGWQKSGGFDPVVLIARHVRHCQRIQHPW